MAALDCPFCGIRLLERNTESDQQAVASHVENHALVAIGDFSEQREVLVQKQHDLRWRKLLRHAGEPAQVGKQDDGIETGLIASRRMAVDFRRGKDPVHQSARHVAFEALRHFRRIDCNRLRRCRFLLARLMARKQRLDPYQELVALYRLRKKIVSADLQALNAVFAVVGRGQEDHRGQRGSGIGLDALADFEAGHALHQQVEHNKFR